MKSMRSWAALGAGAVGLVAAAGLWSARAVAAAPPHAAEVTFLEGKAKRTAVGNAVESTLKQGDQLAQGDIVSTEEKSRLELRLDDKSILRLGPAAQITLKEAQFGAEGGKRRLTVRLIFGNLWAKVTSLVNGEQRFAVETENAVAGVRGTTFRVDAHTKGDVLVRVYDGSVAVGSPEQKQEHPAGTLRHEVEGPAEVTRAAWEKLVGAQMQIVISRKGVPGEPTPFTDADEAADAWAKWNKERDAK